LSASWLASSLFHESIHWDQQYGPKYRFGTINDVEAYKAEIDNSKRFGLTPEEIKEVRSRYDRELRGLRPPYDDQVRKGDYSVPDIYQVPRVKH